MGLGRYVRLVLFDSSMKRPEGKWLEEIKFLERKREGHLYGSFLGDTDSNGNNWCLRNMSIVAKVNHKLIGQ